MSAMRKLERVDVLESRIDERLTYARNLIDQWIQGNKQPVQWWLSTELGRNGGRTGVRARRMAATIGYIGLTSSDDQTQVAARQIMEEVMREKI